MLYGYETKHINEMLAKMYSQFTDFYEIHEVPDWYELAEETDRKETEKSIQFLETNRLLIKKLSQWMEYAHQIKRKDLPSIKLLSAIQLVSDKAVELSDIEEEEGLLFAIKARHSLFDKKEKADFYEALYYAIKFQLEELVAVFEMAREIFVLG